MGLNPIFGGVGKMVKISRQEAEEIYELWDMGLCIEEIQQAYPNVDPDTIESILVDMEAEIITSETL